MKRMLKTKYPCKDCGAPAEVAHRREIEHARCDRCSAHRLASRRAWHGDRECDQAVMRAREAKTSAAVYAAVLLAAAKRLEAAARCMEAAEVAPSIRAQRYMLQRAEERVAWATGTLEKGARHYTAASESVLTSRGLTLLDGGAAQVEIADVPMRTMPEVRVIIGGRGEP